MNRPDRLNAMMMPLGPAIAETQRLMDESLIRADPREGVSNSDRGA